MQNHFLRKKKFLSAALIILLSVLTLSWTLTAVSCAVQLTPGGAVKNSLINTLQTLDKEAKKIVDNNEVLKTMSDMNRSAYKITAAVPEEIMFALTGTNLFPAEYTFSNDVKNNAMSFTTSLLDKKLGVYIDNKNIVLEGLSTPILIDAGNAAAEITDWAAANGLGDISGSIPADLNLSYEEIFNSGDLRKEIENMKTKFDNLKLINELIDSATCVWLENKTLKMETKNINANVYKVTMREEDFSAWYKRALDKIDKDAGFDDIFNVLAMSSGMSKAEMIDALAAYNDFEGIEDFSLQVYTFKDKMIKCEFYYDDTLYMSVGLLGEKNMTDMIEIQIFEGSGEEYSYTSTITGQGNLVPENNSVNYTITGKYEDNSSSESSSVTFNWDLSESEENNFTVSGTDMDKYSMFFGLSDKNTVGIRIPLPTFPDSPVNLQFEPLDGKIDVPTNGRSLDSVDMSEIEAELMNLFGF